MEYIYASSVSEAYFASNGALEVHGLQKPIFVLVLQFRSWCACHLLHSAQCGAGVLVICGGELFQVHAVGRRDVFERHSHGSLEPKL